MYIKIIKCSNKALRAKGNVMNDNFLKFLEENRDSDLTMLERHRSELNIFYQEIYSN